MAERKRRSSRRLDAVEHPQSERRIPIGVWLVGGFSIAALVLVFVFALANQRPTVVEATDYSGISTEWIDRTLLGDPDAPVTLQLWEDFRCPACGFWNQNIKPALMESVRAGTIRFDYRHLPLPQHEPGASLAAQASECAADQNAFWPYHDRLFAAQAQGASAFTAENMIQIAEELNLNSSDFSACLLNQKYVQKVTASAAEARSLGLSGTPTVLVNGRAVTDSLALTAIVAEIEAAGGEVVE